VVGFRCPWLHAREGLYSRRARAGEISPRGGAVATDRELIARVAQEDEVAFQQVYERFADRVFRYAFTLLRDTHLAEEVAQEAMVVVWKGASRFAGRSKVSTWIFGIARNKAFDLIRKEERGKRVPDVPLVSPDPAANVLREERVVAALERLPKAQREVVFLTFYEGLQYSEIAEVLEIPVGTVKSRMFHAKRRLAEALT
jgi:RNA polymerase sigma-70 factor (ECF subfamily)